jgi:hypothetical protein
VSLICPETVSFSRRTLLNIVLHCHLFCDGDGWMGWIALNLLPLMVTAQKRFIVQIRFQWILMLMFEKVIPVFWYMSSVNNEALPTIYPHLFHCQSPSLSCIVCCVLYSDYQGWSETQIMFLHIAVNSKNPTLLG